MPELILASTSRYRRELMERLGVPFCAVAPDVDEDAYKQKGWSPQFLAEQLAGLKAASISRLHPAAIVVGSDQVATCEGIILGKPGSLAAAEAQLQLLSGKMHQLITAVAVHCGDVVQQHTDITRLFMRSLTPAEINAYVLADQPQDCAGSYRMESRGITLFERVESSDHTAITGLPLIALTTLLRNLGLAVPPLN